MRSDRATSWPVIRRPVIRWIAALACAIAAGPARAQVLQKEIPADARGLEPVDKLGAPLPLSTILTDSSGREVTLGEQFNQGRPVILLLAYYDCPMVCPLVQDRLGAALNQIDFTAGVDYSVVCVSFDPSNTLEQAARARQDRLDNYDRPRTARTEAGFAYHLASAPSAKMIADAMGYAYRYIPETGEYAHPVMFAVCTPDGKISRYLFGFDYPARDLKLALMDASGGEIAGGLGDYFLHLCYRYDPTRGAFFVSPMAVMRLGAGATTVLVAIVLGTFWMHERTRRLRRARGEQAEPTPAGAPAGATRGEWTA